MKKWGEITELQIKYKSVIQVLQKISTIYVDTLGQYA